MSTDSNNRPGWAHANPYAATAVASAALGTNMVTIATPAIREALGCLDAYLGEPPATGEQPVGAGNVVAVVGDYGTGKTHLALELQRRARQMVRNANPHVIHIEAKTAGSVPNTGDAPVASFVSIYRRFIAELQEADVAREVREYYTDILIEDLATSDLTVGIAEHLRQRPTFDPHLVTEKLGLAETDLLRQVERRLRQVTHNPSFAKALTLMLRPGFQDAVWSWLCGGLPAPILVERGIASAISTDEAALDAIGVFAILYGRRDHRFVLVIDEVEKLLSGPHQPPDTVLAAFKKLLNVFGDARAFLVLVGLPDFLQTLEKDILQRVGHTIHMSALTVDNIRQFILESQRRISPDAGLEPFTPESVEYLAQVSEGSPRRVIRLCHHLYRRATEEGIPVTPQLVQEVARVHINVFSTDDIRARVRMILGNEGWQHSTSHMLGTQPLTRLDEWVYVGDGGDGYGIIVTDAILDTADVERLTQRGLAIRAAAPETLTLLIINGPSPPADTLSTLSVVFGEEPMVYHPQSFDYDLARRLKSMETRIYPQAADQTLEPVYVERINRQQSNIYRLIEQLTDNINAMRFSADRKLTSLQGEVANLVRAASAPTAGPADRVQDSSAPPRLPPKVNQLFTNALDSLADIGRVGEVLHEVFSTASHPAQNSSISVEIRAALRSQDAVRSLGIAVLLYKLVEAFQGALADWYLTYTQDLRGRLSPSHKNQLDKLCYTYDSIYGYLPLHQLAALTELVTVPTHGRSITDAPLFSRRPDVREVLDGLGSRVHEMMFTAASLDGPD